MDVSITILIQLLNAAVCKRSQSIINLTTLATVNKISNKVQNRVISLASSYGSIEDIAATIECIITESEIESFLLTEV